MDRLKGKTILIGREAEQGCLAVAVLGCNKKATIGSVGSVPNSVSRCRPDMRTAHCKIDIDQSGNLTLTNMKPENFTCVGGIQIQSKKIDSTSVITLGKDRYPINLNVVLQTAIKIVGNSVTPPQPKTCSIKHLEKVWNEYEEAMDDIALRKEQRVKKARLPFIISMGIGLISTILGLFPDTKKLLAFTIPVTLLAFFITLKNYFEKDTSRTDTKQAENKLIDTYVCPNCLHFMEKHSYKVLRQSRRCPYCGCNFTE